MPSVRGDSDERTHKLLFELSHPVRFKILHVLADEPRRLTDIAHDVDAHSPEVSRHLDRLRAAGILEKHVDGTYGPTPMGVLILNCLSSIKFLSERAEYFQAHDLSLLPAPFVSRLGELRESELGEGSFSNLNRAREVIYRAETFLIGMTHENMPEVEEIVVDKVAKGLKYRVVGDEHCEREVIEMNPDPRTRDIVSECLRIVPMVPAAGIVNEKEAVVTFPSRDGKLDYSMGFYSTAEPFRHWFIDLTNHMWAQGRRWRWTV